MSMIFPGENRSLCSNNPNCFIRIARAVLEGMAYQVRDLLDAMEDFSPQPLSVLRVDGGASVSDFMMQFQADILQKPIDRPKLVETTALGTAFSAGLAAGLWHSPGEILGLRTVDRVFTPQMSSDSARAYIANWQRAVERSKGWEIK